jgi:phosphoadenosine phosphosulfate reductase
MSQGEKAVQSRMRPVDDQFLKERLEESRRLVRTIAALSKKPLIIQFSGGRDSMALLGLVREVTANFVCAYMATGLEFDGVLQFVRQTSKQLGVPLIVSNPAMHKGNIFKRVEQFKTWPGLIATWCCRDLKLRPEKKLLQKLYGKGTFYKLEGIRMWESTRRKAIYKEVSEVALREDGEHKGSYEVFPILKWNDSDVLNYLAMKGLPTSGLYNEFGVSGCSWCPFYQPDIYRRVLAKLPNHYDRFIEWEKKLKQPSVNGHVYLRDIKKEVLEGVPLPPAESPARTPCQMMFEGKIVPTCSVYGHLYLNGKCYRCDEPQLQEGKYDGDNKNGQ